MHFADVSRSRTGCRSAINFQLDTAPTGKQRINALLNTVGKPLGPRHMKEGQEVTEGAAELLFFLLLGGWLSRHFYHYFHQKMTELVVTSS